MNYRKQITDDGIGESLLSKKASPVKDSLEISNIRQLFSALIKNFPEGSISIINNDLNFLYTGGRLYDQLKFDPAKLTGQSIQSIFPASISADIGSILLKVFYGANVSEYELPACCSKDDHFIMDAFPLVEKDNSIRYAGVIIRNITKLKKVEDKLRRSLQVERKLNELKSRFVTMASHEFRTPLSTILSSTYLLGRYTTTEEQPQREKHLGRIINSVNMLTDILNDFLSLGKIEEGKITLRPVDTNITELVNKTCNEIKSLFKQNQVVTYDHSGDEMINLDNGLLKHILLNLLSNAIKFSGDSIIAITTVNEEDYFSLSVKDQGLGISIEDQKHLYERFFRSENVTHIQGTGLGLHIVSRYAELMNGKVYCISELGKGTEFIVKFDKRNPVPATVV